MCIFPISLSNTQSFKALCFVVRDGSPFSLLSLLFNPVTSAPWAGEVSQRLSHGLRANPTPRALPEGRPSVRSVWSVLGGKASAAWPNSTFQHTPPSRRKARSSLFSSGHVHAHSSTYTQLVPKHKQINTQTVRSDSSLLTDLQSKSLKHNPLFCQLHTHLASASEYIFSRVGCTLKKKRCWK